MEFREGRQVTNKAIYIYYYVSTETEDCQVEEKGKRMTDDCQDLMRLGEERVPFDNGVSTELWSGPASLSCQRAPTDTKKLTVKMKYIAVQIYRSANFWQKRQTFQVASFVCVYQCS